MRQRTDSVVAKDAGERQSEAMTDSADFRSQIKPLLWLGLPLVGGQLAQASISIVDTAMMGRYDLEDLAGVVLATTLWITVFLVGSGFAWAVTPMVAAAGDDTVRIRRITRMGLWASMGYGVLMLPVLLAGAPILRALGQPEAPTAVAGEYLAIVGWGLFPALGVMLLKSYLAALQRTAVVLWVTLLALGVNTVLNWVLIFGALGAPELGARGAALASVASHCVTLVALVIYAKRSFPEQELFVRLWRPDWFEFRQVVRLGAPIGVATLAEASLFSATSVMMGWISVVALAAHGIALQIAMTTFNFHIGVSQAATILSGRAYGRRDWDMLRAVARAALLVSAVAALSSLAVMLVVPGWLVTLFADPADPLHDGILAVGTTLVMMAGVFQLADGAQVVLINLLRGVQDTRVPMVLTTLSYWGVGASTAYLFGIVLNGGGVGLWSGLVLGLACAAVLLWRRFWYQRLPEVEAAAAE